MDHIVISIARQYGSGGRTVGEMLAKKMGISYYDKQIIRMASDESGIDLSLFGKVEGGVKVKPSLFSRTGLYKGDLIQPDSREFISDENLFNYQAKIVRDLAEKERSEEHTSELQSRFDLVCRLLLEKKKKNNKDKV